MAPLVRSDSLYWYFQRHEVVQSALCTGSEQAFDNLTAAAERPYAYSQKALRL